MLEIVLDVVIAQDFYPARLAVPIDPVVLAIDGDVAGVGREQAGGLWGARDRLVRGKVAAAGVVEAGAGKLHAAGVGLVGGRWQAR